MRMTHVDFLERLQLIEPDIKPLLCFRLRLGVSSITISPFSTTFTKAYSSFAIFEHWTNDVRKQDAVSMDSSRWASVVHGTHARAKHVWHGCPNEQRQQTNKASPIKHETKEMFQFVWFNVWARHDPKVEFPISETVDDSGQQVTCQDPWRQNIWTVYWQVEIMQLSMASQA